MELNETAVTIAAFIGTALAAYIGYFRKGKEDNKQVIIDGALVDSSAVKDLAAALREHTKLMAESGEDGDKARKLGYELRESLDDFTREVQEVRRVLERMVDRMRN